MKRSFKHMLGFALGVSIQNGAKVVFYVPSYERAKEGFDMLHAFAVEKGYKVDVRGLSFEWPGGGKLSLRVLDDTTRNRDGGLMITHAFVDEAISWELKQFAESRIRTTGEFTVEAGLYTPEWARVCKQY